MDIRHSRQITGNNMIAVWQAWCMQMLPQCKPPSALYFMEVAFSSGNVVTIECAVLFVIIACKRVPVSLRVPSSTTTAE